MTFSEQVTYAMFKPSKYKELVNLKTSRFVTFVIIICLMLGVVTFAVPTAAKISAFGGFEKLFGSQISELSYKDGSLSIAEPFEFNIDGVRFIIDTDKEIVSDDKLEADGYYIAFGSKSMRVVYVYDHKIYDDTALDLAYLLPDGLNNQMLIDVIPVIYGSLVFAFIINCVMFFLKYGFYALILSLMINSFNVQFNLKLTRGQVFQICFYGETLGMVVANFNMAMGLLPYDIVNIIMIFVSMNIITKSVILMNPKHHV